MKIITKDLFEASYLHTHGVRLGEVFGDKRSIVFQFEGNGDLEVLKNAWNNGEAVVNVKKFKKSLTELKDIMFSKIRSQDTWVAYQTMSNL